MCDQMDHPRESKHRWSMVQTIHLMGPTERRTVATNHIDWLILIIQLPDLFSLDIDPLNIFFAVRLWTTGSKFKGDELVFA